MVKRKREGWIDNEGRIYIFKVADRILNHFLYDVINNNFSGGHKSIVESAKHKKVGWQFCCNKYEMNDVVLEYQSASVVVS